MQLTEIVRSVADILKDFDCERPVHKSFKPGIGPFGEPQLVIQIAQRLTRLGIAASTRATPADMDIQGEWAIEFKIVRPFGDNDKEAESWSQNLLHPYEGNVSLIGDAIKLSQLPTYPRKGVIALGFEHAPPRIDLEPLFSSFELIAKCIMNIPLGGRCEEWRDGLVHPTHQSMRCVGWQLNDCNL